MNERIRELIHQTNEWMGVNAQGDMWEREQKFAELIVQKCITLVDSTPIAYDDYRKQIEEEMRDDCRDRLKNHFGVE